MRTTSVTPYELGSILDRLIVTTSTYAGVFHIISGRHPELGRITVVQGITDIMILTEEVKSEELRIQFEASEDQYQRELPLLQAA